MSPSSLEGSVSEKPVMANLRQDSDALIELLVSATEAISGAGEIMDNLYEVGDVDALGRRDKVISTIAGLHLASQAMARRPLPEVRVLENRLGQIAHTLHLERRAAHREGREAVIPSELLEERQTLHSQLSRYMTASR